MTHTHVYTLDGEMKKYKVDPDNDLDADTICGGSDEAIGTLFTNVEYRT